MIARAICPVLVAREEELSALEDALLAACRGEGAVLVLAGDAGMGKTRLCTELVRRAEKIGAAVMEGSCSEAELALPYLPFLEAVGNYLEAADVAAIRGRLGVHARQLATLFPQLGADGPAEAGTDTPDARLRLFEALLALLRIAAEEGGLLLVVEDLHWADASTRELLDYLTRRLRNTRVLVLATYRRDEMHRRHPLLPTVQAWQRSRLATVVELDPLPPAGVARMVSAIFDDTQVGGEFRDFLHERTEGNPFVIEEMLKAALDRGDIYRDGGNWQRKPLGELRIPETVRDTILLRLERLDPEQVEILRCGSVLGRSFDYQTLLEVARQDRATIETALQAAVQQQLLEEEAGGRYRFRHALTQEAIYDDLSAPTRERLHGAAAEVLGRRADAAAETAYHLRAAHRWEEATTATLRAAHEAEARHGYDEAARLYELLLPVVTHGVERSRLLCRLGEALWRATKPAAAIEPLREGVRGLQEGGEPLEAARHQLTLGRCLWETGDTPAALQTYETARGALEAAGPSRDLALAHLRLAGLAIFDLRGADGQHLAERAIEVAREAGAEDVAIWAQNFRGLGIAFQGDYATGTEILERSIRDALDRQLVDIAGNAMANLAILYEATMQTSRLPALADQLEQVPIEQWGVLRAGFTRLMWAHLTGRVVTGLAIGQEVVARSQATGSAASVYPAQVGVAQLLVELDRIEEAQAALPPYREEGDGQERGAVLWGQLRLTEETGDWDGALTAAERLLDLGEASPDRDEAAALAVEAFVHAGRIDSARELLTSMRTSGRPMTEAAAYGAEAVIALAEGRVEAARELLELGIAVHDAAELVPRGTRLRLLLARALVEAGEREEAVRVLREAWANSQERGLRLLARQSAERLAELGVLAEEPELPPIAPDAPAELGERLVTVMFADVRGYTALSGETPPPDLVDRIAAYQRWAGQEVERRLGTVDKFAGDAVMATFNVSGASVDHARHALEAALALRDKAALLGLPVGIGIATGAAVVGRLAEGANLSVLGPATNLASRLQAQARAGEILLSEECHRRLEGVEATREELELKGFEGKVPAYRLGEARGGALRPSPPG